MNNIKRLLFGALSTLLLAVGFARAATHFDPVSNDVPREQSQELRMADGCSGVCDEFTTSAPACTGVCDEVGH
jgi:hypothetical protein